ncbi:hypothetical protein CSA17_07345 [bacterium DOLJORAL78_65_58]|nr:MAG: hypothetical protein CSA17_07345 [bacterium DOLJORAL78_65_58]
MKGRAAALLTVVLVLVLVWPGPIQAQTDAQRARTVQAHLTLEQQVGQLFLVYHSPAGFMAEHGFGGSLVMESMLRDADALQASLQEARARSVVPPLAAIDQEGGRVNRLRPLPGFEHVPGAADLATLPADSIRATARQVAWRMAELGLNLNLAPVVDPTRNVDHQFTLMHERGRSFGRESADIVPPARAFMSGCGDAGVLCTLKHFPGYVVSRNSDHEVAESHANRSALLGYIHPFAACMDSAGAVMMSSIHYSLLSDVPAVFDRDLVSLARCGFAERVVMTDDLWGTALRVWIHGGPVQRADYPAADLRRLTLAAFDAGNDMLMITFPAKAVAMKRVLVEACRADPERRARLEASVGRILLLKARLGLI